MLFLLLMILDILCIIAFTLWTIVPTELVLVVGALLFIKGLVFALSGNKVSWIDVLAGLYLISTIFGFSYWLLTFIFIVYLVQKVIVGLFSV